MPAAPSFPAAMRYAIIPVTPFGRTAPSSGAKRPPGGGHRPDGDIRRVLDFSRSGEADAGEKYSSPMVTY